MGAAPMRASSPPQYEQQQQQAKPGRMAKMPTENTSDEGGGGGGGGGDEAIGYNAAEFKHLNVSDEIRELFKHIGRYQVCRVGEGKESGLRVGTGRCLWVRGIQQGLQYGAAMQGPQAARLHPDVS